MMGYGLPAQGQSPAPVRGKPALYDFGRGMCLPCKEMEKVLAAIESEYGSQIEVRLVMLEKNEDLNQMMAMGVFMTPALVVDGEVKVVGKVPSEEELKKMIG
jgi:thiol-disulfide isomerase/thioredoxin